MEKNPRKTTKSEVKQIIGEAAKPLGIGAMLGLGAIGVVGWVSGAFHQPEQSQNLDPTLPPPTSPAVAVTIDSRNFGVPFTPTPTLKDARISPSLSPNIQEPLSTPTAIIAQQITNAVTQVSTPQSSFNSPTPFIEPTATPEPTPTPLPEHINGFNVNGIDFGPDGVDANGKPLHSQPIHIEFKATDGKSFDILNISRRLMDGESVEFNAADPNDNPAYPDNGLVITDHTGTFNKIPLPAEGLRRYLEVEGNFHDQNKKLESTHMKFVQNGVVADGTILSVNYMDEKAVKAYGEALKQNAAANGQKVKELQKQYDEIVKMPDGDAKTQAIIAYNSALNSLPEVHIMDFVPNGKVSAEKTVKLVICSEADGTKDEPFPGRFVIDIKV